MLLDQLFNDLLTSMTTSTEGLAAWWQDNDLFLELELPGYDKGKISIIRDNDSILIEATKFEVPGNKEYIIKNSSYPEVILRKYLLPKCLDEDKTEAAYENGILRVRMPKSANALSKRISIK